MKKVYFRADGNATIGLGHITRCMALADMLAGHFRCTFLVQNASAELTKQIQDNNHYLIPLPTTSDYLTEAGEITRQYFSSDSIVVLDGYEFRTDYQRIIKYSNCKLVCIDDLHAWHFVADAVINHAGNIEPQKYSCEQYTKLYLGSEYALLRKPFLIASKKKESQHNKNVFVCFGGADPGRLTRKFVGFMVKMNWPTSIIAVVGRSYVGLDELILLRREYPKLEVYQDVSADEMANLIGKCSFAIAPASTIGYELAAMGIVWLGGWYVENQKKIYEYFKDEGCLIPVGNFTTTNEIEFRTFTTRIEADQKSCQSVIEAQKRAIDGESDRRLLELFK